jgi:3-dehydroquinate synthetase
MLRAIVARVLVATVSSTIAPQVGAEVIGTSAVINPDREHILALLERPGVAAQLEAYGVKPTDARARIAALSDAEVATLSAEIDKASVGAGGGGGVIGAMLAGVATTAVIAAAIVVVPIVLAGLLVVGIVRAGIKGRGAPAYVAEP